MPEPTPALSSTTLAEIVRHAEEAAPREACGTVRRSGRVRRACNVQDDLHRADPARYPRTAEDAFQMSGEDLLDIDRSLSGPDPVSVVYHSHPGGAGAYFSAEDERLLVADGAPLLPVDHLVVAVGVDGRAHEARLYRWDASRFTETCHFEIESETIMQEEGVVVTVPRNFGTYADGACEWNVQGGTVTEALAAATSGHPELRDRIFDPRGKGLRSYVRVFVDDEQADADTPLEGGAHVRVLPALGGGAPSRIAASILDAVGDTPLVELSVVVRGTAVRLLVKVESMNPTGSHKVRAALSIVDAAEAAGLLVRGSGQVIVAPTGGNLGYALAVIARRRGYRLIAVVPDNYSPRKIAMLQLLGAEVELADSSLGNDAHAVRAAELAVELGDAYLVNQFDDPANQRAYARTTAPEILRDLGDVRLDYLVGGIGSGAHLSAIGSVLKEAMPELVVVGVQPAECDLLKGHVVPHHLQGLAATAGLPPFVDPALVSSIESVTVQEALAALRATMLDEGISLGLSSAANIAACLRIARRLNAPATMLTFVYDAVGDYLDGLDDLAALSGPDDDPPAGPGAVPATKTVRRDPGDVKAATPAELARDLETAGVVRGYVVSRGDEVVASHEALEPLRSLICASERFAGHEAVFVGVEPGLPTFFLACVHDTTRGLAQGGVRFRSYSDVGSAVDDGLDLSHAMSRKNALAGLWWGGGKAVVPLPEGYDDPGAVKGVLREGIFAAFGRFVASLGGIYYTAEDMGTSTADMDRVLANNRFTTCVSPEAGGSGDPSPLTSRGVLLGMRAAWEVVTGNADLSGVKVGVQGVGHVGSGLVDLLVAAGAKVTVADVDAEAVAEVLRRHPVVEALPAADDSLFAADLDILAPCAVGGAVNARTIPLLRARVVCGAANNMLADAADADRLHGRGILYVPDFVTNRMGIVNCANEAFGHLPSEVERAVAAVYDDVWSILRTARSQQITPAAAADRLADEAMKQPHPMYPGRGRALLDHLVTSAWGAARPDASSSSDDGAAASRLVAAMAEV